MLFVLMNRIIYRVGYFSVMSAEHVSEMDPKPGDKFIGFVTSVCSVISFCQLILCFIYNDLHIIVFQPVSLQLLPWLPSKDI